VIRNRTEELLVRCGTFDFLGQGTSGAEGSDRSRTLELPRVRAGRVAGL